MIDLLDRDRFPPEHVAQCQGALWVAEREWIDLAVYWPGLPLYVSRLFRDEAYIANMSAEVDRFNDDLDALVAKIKRIANPNYGTSDATNLLLVG